MATASSILDDSIHYNEGKKRALIASISSYNNRLPSLEFCQKDGEEMYQLLRALGYEITALLHNSLFLTHLANLF